MGPLILAHHSDSTIAKKMSDWLSFEDFDSSVYWPVESVFDTQLNDMMDRFWRRDSIAIYIQGDIEHWKTLPANVKKALTFVLHMFFSADSFANALTLEHLMGEYKDMHMRGMISFHGFMEVIHAQVYGLLLKPVYPDGLDKRRIYAFICSSPAVSGMLKWGHTYAQPGLKRTTRLFGVLAFEGIIFTPLFAIFYAVKSMNVLVGMCQANEYIARDELMHVNNALLLLFHELEKGDLLDSIEWYVELRALLTGAMACADLLLDEALPEDIPEWNMNKIFFREYTRTLANKIAEALGMPAMYKVDLEMPEFLKKKELMQLTSFHSLRGTQYKQALPIDTDALGAVMDSLAITACAESDEE